MTKRITQLRARAAAAGVTLRVFRRRDYHVDGKPVRYGIVDPYGELFFSTLSEVHERISRYERNKRAGLPPVHVLAQAEPTR